MRKIKLLLLVLLPMLIPNFLLAYTKDQIVSFDNNQTYYKVIQPDGTTGVTPTLKFLSTKNAGHLDIPATIDDKSGVTFTVIEVGYQRGYDSKKVTSVKLPNTIKTLGDYCFSEADLSEIEIPASVDSISYIAMRGPKNTPVIKVNAGNHKYMSDENGVLYSKDKKRLYNIPKVIAEKTGSDTYTVDEKVTIINRGAFPDNAGLKKIVLPKNLQNVEQVYPPIATTNSLEAFEIASDNPKFKVVDGVLFDKKKQELVCYPRGKKTTNYKVPDEIKQIGSYGIMSPQEMISLDLNKVVKTAWASIYNAKKLETITIPAGLTKTGLATGSIAECLTLKEYKVAEGNPDFTADGGVLFSANKDILYFYPPNNPATSYEIPETVKEVADKAFQAARNITSLAIPTNVKKIGTDAFRNMLNIETATFKQPSSTQELNASSFWNCKKLKTVTLPSSITELNQVFIDCVELETVIMPGNSKLKTIKSNAFITNKKLKTFKFEGSCDLETIEENAFANAESLESFNLPKSVKNIKRNAFTGCKSLATVTFDEDAVIEEIGEGAFADCGLQDISIPKKVTKIAKEAFRNCKVLKKINIAKATTNIDPLAFQYCSNLTDINVEKENTKYSSVDGYLLSQNKKELILFPPGKANKKFTLLPPSIEKVGEYSFFNCEKLTNVTIPNKVTTIGKRAFGLCKNLKTITFLCDKMIPVANINTANNEMSFDDGTQTAGQSMFDHITINVRKELATNYNGEAFYKKFKGGIKESFTIGDEEYIAMSEESVNMLSTTRKDHTFVLPTSIKHNNKDYKVSLIGDYAFQKVTTDVKEVVVKKDVEYIGAEAFITADKTQPILNIFFIEGNPTKQMLSTTRFELDETGTNYNEFAKKTKIYVKKSALDTYKEKWNKQVYDINTHAYKTREFNFIDQLDYKIPGVAITHKYGTFSREFDTDFSEYKKENHSCDIGAFVAPVSGITQGPGDYGTSKYKVRMVSVDEKGGPTGEYGYVPAETGVLLKVLDVDSTPSGFFYTIGEKDDHKYTISNNMMKAVTVNEQTVTKNSNPFYVVSAKKGIFMKAPSPTFKMPIHKAYAKITGVPVGAKVMFSFTDDNSSTTGIDTIDTSSSATGSDNAYYNLNGQRIEKPQHGVYIHGGKKVIIK